MKKHLVGKPVLMDKLDAELGAKVVQAIIDDNERAKKKREDKRRARDEASKDS